MADVWAGVNDVAWAARHLATRPSLWKWAAAPVIIGALPLVVLWVAFRAVGGTLVWIAELLPGPLGSAFAAADTWAVGVMWSGSYVWLVAVLAVITTPFCELISERVEVELTDCDEAGFSLLAFSRDIALGVAHALRRAVVYVATILVLLLVAGLVPVIGPALYTAGAIYVTVRFAAYDALDTVWARKGIRYAAKTTYLSEHRARAYAIGALVALVVAVPLAQVLAFPIGAIAATRLYVEDAPGPG